MFGRFGKEGRGTATEVINSYPRGRNEQLVWGIQLNRTAVHMRAVYHSCWYVGQLVSIFIRSARKPFPQRTQDSGLICMGSIIALYSLFHVSGRVTVSIYIGEIVKRQLE